MQGQLGQMGVEIAGMALLDRLGDPAVRATAPSACELVDDRRPHDVVGKAEAQRSRLEHQARRDRLVERGEH